MNIGIIVYSYTNHTYDVAIKLQASLKEAGYFADVERITVENNDEGFVKNIVFTNKPDPSKYDVIVLASPVQRFTLGTVMKAYLNQLPPLVNKSIYAFVTKALKAKWLGGNISIKIFKKYAILKKANFKTSAIICWEQPNTFQQIENMIDEFKDSIKMLN